MANQQIDNIEDINEAINPITPPIDGQEGLEMLGHNRNQSVILSRFSRSFFKIYSHLITLYSSIKSLGQNKLDKGGYDGTALELKNWLVTNYTTLMNNIRDTLTNSINTKLPHGGYNQSAQTLKNEIDTKVSNTGGNVSGDMFFTNQDKGIRFSRVSSGTVPIYREGGDFCTAGCDYAGLEKINNIAIQSWFGFSVSSTYGSGSVPIGQCAFSVDARSGNAYTFGNLYAEKNKRVYHEGYKPSASDIGAVSKSGDVMTGTLTINKNWADIKLTAPNTPENYRNKCLELGETGSLNIITRNASNQTNGMVTISPGKSGEVYHTGNKPTPSEVGAVNKSGDTMTGNLSIKTNNYPSLHLDNTANGYNKALRIEHSQANLLRFIKYTDIGAGTQDKTLDWDMSVGGTIYHTGKKPTPGEIGALNKSGDLIGGALRFNASNRLTADYTSGSGVLGTASGAGIRGGFDTASMSHTACIDIYSWNGISFSSAYGDIREPRFLMDCRNNTFISRGNIMAYQNQAVITDIRLSGNTKVITWNKAVETYSAGRVITGVGKDTQGENLDWVHYATLQKRANNTWYTVAVV